MRETGNLDAIARKGTTAVKHIVAQFAEALVRVFITTRARQVSSSLDLSPQHFCLYI
jgi:hypothetical protein